MRAQASSLKSNNKKLFMEAPFLPYVLSKGSFLIFTNFFIAFELKDVFVTWDETFLPV